MKLTKEQWNQLDTLLGKIGFGGYYDLMELLRQTGWNLTKIISDWETRQKWYKTIEEEKDMVTLVTLINWLSSKGANP